MSLAVLYITLAQTYMYWKRFDYSVNYFDEAIKILERLDYKRYKSALYCDVGVLYYHMEMYDKAEEFYKKVDINSYRESKDWWREAQLFHNIGALKLKQGKLDGGHENLTASVKILREHDSPISLAGSYSRLGDYYLLIGNNLMAKESYSDALRLIPSDHPSFKAQEIRKRVLEHLNNPVCKFWG